MPITLDWTPKPHNVVTRDMAKKCELAVHIVERLIDHDGLDVDRAPAVVNDLYQMINAALPSPVSQPLESLVAG